MFECTWEGSQLLEHETVQIFMWHSQAIKARSPFQSDKNFNKQTILSVAQTWPHQREKINTSKNAPEASLQLIVCLNQHKFLRTPDDKKKFVVKSHNTSNQNRIAPQIKQIIHLPYREILSSPLICVRI